MKRMKKSNLFYSVVLLTLVLMIFTSYVGVTNAASNESEYSPVNAYVVNLKQDIDTITVQYVKRAINTAKEEGVQTLVLKLNTYGGELDSTIEIGELLQNSNLNVISYVETKAMSAGTLIALHTPTIYMQEGSTIGAASIVNSAGEPVSGAKENSFLQGKVSEIANLHGRNAQIALAMVDPYHSYDLQESLGIIKPENEVLTLGANDAVKAGFVKAVVKNFDDLLVKLDLNQNGVKLIETSFTERLAKFLTHPLVVIILLVLGIAGIVIELLYPGFGAPGIIGLISLAMFFFGSYIAGISEKETAFLFIIGILLIIIELFVPTFGILAILGGGAVITGILLASVSLKSGLISFGIALAIAIVLIILFSKTKKGKSIWSKLVLKEKLTSEEGFVPAELQDNLVGKLGTTITALRPAGTALIDDKRVDVLTEGGFVEANRPVIVVKAEGTWVVVRENK